MPRHKSWGFIWREVPENALERDLEDRCVKLAQRAYPGTLHRKMNGLGKRDWPDQLLLFPSGIKMFVEFKRRGERPTPKQASLHRKLRRLGHEVHVCDSVESFLRAFKRTTGY